MTEQIALDSTQTKAQHNIEQDPVPLPRQRNIKPHENLSANTSSNDDTISSCGTKTVIIEKADVHQPAPPVPFPRKKFQNVSSILSDSDEKPDDVNAIQTMPTITEVRSISSSQTDNTNSQRDKDVVEFLKKKSQTFLAKSQTTENDDRQIEINPKSSTNKNVPEQKMILINEKKHRCEKLAILVEKISTDNDETSYESSDKSEFNESSSGHAKEIKTKDKPKLIGKLRVPKSKEDSSNSNKNNFDYDYEEIFGIYIHETSELKFDRLISGPMIRMSIFNGKNGKLLGKSDPSRNVVLNLEPKNVEFIQPIISKRSHFVDEK